jgi:hypothetical protein
MPDLEELVEKAKNLLSKHPGQVHKGVEKAEELAGKQLGGEFGGQTCQCEGSRHARPGNGGTRVDGHPDFSTPFLSRTT